MCGSALESQFFMNFLRREQNTYIKPRFLTYFLLKYNVTVSSYDIVVFFFLLKVGKCLFIYLFFERKERYVINQKEYSIP